ncbi:MAG: PEP-CTERM sorting domain-containing protein [Nitrosospira sp.]
MRAAGVWSATILPEPETYAMLLTGLGLIGFIARRQNGPQRARSSEFPIPFKTVRMNS